MSLLCGANYIGAVKVSGNLLPTAVHAARGRTGVSVLRGTCQRPGSLGHTLQVCPMTRVSRHNKIVSLVQSAAGKLGGPATESLPFQLRQACVDQT